MRSGSWLKSVQIASMAWSFSSKFSPIQKVFCVRHAHDGPASSTASVAENKDEIFSQACVKLKSIRLTPTIGGK